MLNITREEFRKIYHGLAILESEDLFYTEPISDTELLTKYFPSKLWRLNNAYTIVNKWGKLVKFRMNKSQHKVYAASLRHPRLIILKSRQQGISTLWLVSFYDDTITIKNLSIGLMAQGTDEAEALLERVKMLWDKLHPVMKQTLGIELITNNTKEFKVSNGSKIFVRTSFRSTTLQRLHISEMGKIANKYPDKAKETKTGTLQALAQGNLGIVESTAEGDNMFKDMWDTAVLSGDNLTPKDFYPVFLSWLDDPDCAIDIDQPIGAKQAEYFAKLELELGYTITQQQKNFWIVQFRELGERIYQEYPSTPIEAFMATKDGSYYAFLYLMWVIGHKREVEFGKLYDKNLEVQIAIDLGMNDTNVLVVFQTYKEQFRIIGELADNGQDIKYYCDWMKEQYWFPNLKHVILPHDAEVTELTSGKTRTEVFEEELRFNKDGTPTNIEITVLAKTDRNEGIEMVRQVIKNLWMDSSCDYLKKCFINYRKEFDEKRERFRNIPEHDEYSNGADGIRYMAVGARRGILMKKSLLSPNNTPRHKSGEADV